jgi:hypothetical protein
LDYWENWQKKTQIEARQTFVAVIDLDWSVWLFVPGTCEMPAEIDG